MGDCCHLAVVLLSGLASSSGLFAVRMGVLSVRVLGLLPCLLDPLAEEAVGDDVAEDLRGDVVVDGLLEGCHGWMGVALGALHQGVPEDPELLHAMVASSCWPSLHPHARRAAAAPSGALRSPPAPASGLCSR